MGYGLWLVNEMVKALRGEMYVFSDKAFISCEEVTKALCILHEYVTKMGF